jgi:hypothetical protein
MRESPSSFALDFGVVPIRMLASQDTQNHRSSVTPHPMGDRKSLRHSFLLENRCHRVIDDIEF